MIVPESVNLNGATNDSSRLSAEQFEKTRQGLLSELRCLAGLPELVRSLNPEALYRLALPEGRLLQQGSDGLYRGVFYTDAGVERHAKFHLVQPSIFEAVGVVCGQLLLISIANQLGRIESSIEELSAQLRLNNIAEIDAGIKQLGSAKLFSETARREHAILNAVQTLCAGIEKGITDVTIQVEKAPDPIDRWSDHLLPFWDKTKEAAKIIGNAERSFRSVLRGLTCLVECYLLLGESSAAFQTLLASVDKLHGPAKAAAEKARLIEFSGTVAPQRIWERFVGEQQSLLEKVGELRGVVAAQPFTEFEIEFRPHELQGDENDDLPKV